MPREPSPDPSPRASGIHSVAVIDVGKTNTKAVLVDAESGSERVFGTTPTVIRQDGPYPHFDVARTWEFVCAALAGMRREVGVDAVSITAHGSAGAFLSGATEGDGLALPILDYEHTGPDDVTADYDAVRPDFSETFSPRLPAGQNLGAQIFWQERRFGARTRAADSYVNYPQYWGWRLSGVAATEMCSMGAHSDLWNPRLPGWSRLVERMEWRGLLAPLRSAFDRLGRIRPELSRRLGLDPATLVMCGIHDSSASLLPYLKEREPPFTVISTGTWVILFAVGGDIARLDPRRDTLANVSAYGDPVPCGRFMGGREFELLTESAAVEPSEAELERVLSQKIMALPTFAPGVGPFPRGEGRWTADPSTLSLGERSAAAGLYIALVTAETIRAAGGSGPAIVEGPFTANRTFCGALAAITGQRVETSGARTGTTTGAALLATGTLAKRAAPTAEAEPMRHTGLAPYVAAWRAAAGSR